MSSASRFSGRRLALALSAGLAAACLLFFGLFAVRRGVALPTLPKKPALSRQEGLRLHMIDVGQGLAMLLTCNGEAAMVDTGPPDTAEATADYLRRQGVRELRWLFLTHPHEDHIGGAQTVCGAFPVQAVVTPDCPESRAQLTDRGSWGRALSLTVDYTAKGRQYALGGTGITVLHPAEGERWDDLNDLSLVLLVEFEGVRMLLTGDISGQVEQRLIPLGTLDLLQAAHHGSNSSTCAALLEDTTPEAVLISCGRDNDYGHPHQKVLRRLREVDAQVFRTDLQGTLTAAVSEGKLTVTPQR